MFSNVGVGTKIGSAFTILIIASVCLGGLAVVTMNGVKSTAEAMHKQQVPAVVAANDVERLALKTMYNARGYAFTEERRFLDDTRANLAKVKESLGKAKELAATENIEWLGSETEKAEAQTTEYERLFEETVKATEAMTKEKEACLAAAKTYMDNCYAYLSAQEVDVKEKAASSTATAADVLKDFEQIKMMNDVVDLGNLIIADTWRSIASRDPELFRETEKIFDQVNTKLADLRKITVQEEDLQSIDRCSEAGKAYRTSMDSFLKMWLNREELGKARGAAGDNVTAVAEGTAGSGMEKTAVGADTAATSLASGSRIIFIGLFVLVFVGALLAWAVSRVVSGVTNPIRQVIAGLTEGANQVTSASNQVAQSSQAMAEGASEQASSLEETSASLEEMASMTRQNADNANQCNALMTETKQVVDGMGKAMEEMSVAINDIKRSADQTAKIIKTIDEIAFQTNLLALNAAVEAARAGDAGKGFAVVAEEVRNLAQRSAEAAKQTAALLEESQHHADNGVQVTGRVAESLQKTIGSSAKVAELINEIAAASKEQSQGIDQVNSAVAQMDKVTQSNAADSEEAAAAGEELSAQAEELREMVSKLAAVVGGGGQSVNGMASRRAPVSKGTVRRQVESPVRERSGVPAMRAPSHHGSLATAASQPKVMKPEEVIPFTEDELKDF